MGRRQSVKTQDIIQLIDRLRPRQLQWQEGYISLNLCTGKAPTPITIEIQIFAYDFELEAVWDFREQKEANS